MDEREAARAYAVKRANKQNPGLNVETWDELMALPMGSVSLDTFNELLESGLFDIPDSAKVRTQNA